MECEKELRKAQQTGMARGIVCSRSCGFTLVEVLIALAVVALAVVGVFLGSQRALDRTNGYKALRHIHLLAVAAEEMDASGANAEAEMTAAMKAVLGCGTDACESPYGTPYTVSILGSYFQVSFDTGSASAAGALIEVLDRVRNVIAVGNGEQVAVGFGSSSQLNDDMTLGILGGGDGGLALDGIDWDGEEFDEEDPEDDS